MQKKLTIALDIDGTLIDKKGKLDPDVYKLFQKADFDRTNFILMTGNSADNAFDCIDQINNIIPKDKHFHPWISASCGSTIYDPQGNIVSNVSLDKEFIQQVIARSTAINPKCVYMYRDGLKNFIEKQNFLTPNWIGMFYKKYKEAKKGSAGIKFTMLNKKDREQFIADTDIQNLFTVSLNKELQEKIIDDLQKLSVQHLKATGTHYKVYPGSSGAIQTPARSKAEALRIILDLDKDMCSNIADVIYFGDGTNDVECLSICKYSFARGPEAKEKAKEVAKYTYNNLSSVADALFCDENDFESSLANLPPTDVTQEAGLSR